MAKQRFTPEELDALEQQNSPQKKKFTPEELDAIEGVAPSTEPSQIESGARGLAQGATFGFSDEATAALESALTGRPYEEALAETRGLYKKAEEESPLTYGAGQIAGGVATAFVPGIGQLGTAAKGATIGGKIGLGALGGAVTGGLGAAGLSEATDTDQIISDILKGGTLGAAIGGAVPVAIGAAKTVGEGVKKSASALKQGAKEFVEESPLLNIPYQIFKETSEGADLGAKAAREEFKKATKESVDYLQELVKSKAGTIDDVAETIDNLKAQNPKFKVKSVLDEIKEKIKDPDVSNEEKADLRDLLSVVKKASGVKTEEKLVPAGPVKLGAATKAEAKVNKALAEERLKVEKDLLQTQVQIGKVDQYDDPSLFRKLKDKYTSLKDKLTEIDEQASKLKTDLEEEGIVGTLQPSKPIRDVQTGDVIGLTKAKIKAEAVPEKQIGDFTPIKTEAFETVTKPEIGSLESRNLQAELNKLGQMRSEMGKELKRGALEKTKEGIARGDETLKEAVDIANKEFSLAKDVLEEKGLGLKETGLSQDVPYEEALGDIKENYTKLLELSRRAGAAEIVPSETNKAAFESLKQSINNLKKIDPESGKIMENRLLSKAKQYALAEEIVKPRLLGSKDVTGLLGGTLGITYRGAKVAGNMTKALMDSTPDQLKQAASTLTGNSKALMEKIANSESAQRNANIFAAMQRPEFRKDLGITEEEK